MYSVIVRFRGMMFDKIRCGSKETAQDYAKGLRKRYKLMGRAAEYSVSVKKEVR